MASLNSETKYYHHGRFTFEGGTLPDAITAYRTYGDPKNPCIVFPTCYGGRLDSEWLEKGDEFPSILILQQVLKPSKYFVVTFALFSNGEPIPYNGPYFPVVTYEDNIRAQYAVLTKELNVSKIHCVIGFSMGGQQAYYWPVVYPDFVERFVPICGSARTSPHNICFLEGPKAALVASQDFQGGHYTSTPAHGIRAFGRVYSAWAYSQAWFRNKSYLYDGKYTDLDDFLRAEWEADFLTSWDANDMLTLLRTWQLGDISRVKTVGSSLQGDLAGVLSNVAAKGLIMPCKTDLYFPPEDSENEVQSLRNAKLAVIPSIWGHAAGGGANEEDIQFIYKAVGEFLES
ncbi:homoserine acetyltransferase [Trametopsis cervina]|nr:homoserine acetyltransferase [Trametopsis cervina]